MEFRAVVRSAQWRTDFLSKPMSERLQLARSMRMQSEARKRSNTVYADIDVKTANALLRQHGADHMIHGHTHRPGHHALQGTSQRWVLSDWDLKAQPPRAEVLRLTLPDPEQGHNKTDLQRLQWPMTKPTSVD